MSGSLLWQGRKIVQSTDGMGKDKKRGGNTGQSIKIDFALGLHGNHDSFQAMFLHSLRNIFVSPLCLQPGLQEQL